MTACSFLHSLPSAFASSPPALRAAVSAPTNAPPAFGSHEPHTSLGVKIITQTKQASEFTQIARITTAEIFGVGQIGLSYPDNLIGESRPVHLRLHLGQQLTSSSRDTPRKNLPNSPSFVNGFSGNVDLDPVLNA